MANPSLPSNYLIYNAVGVPQGLGHLLGLQAQHNLQELDREWRLRDVGCGAAGDLDHLG